MPSVLPAVRTLSRSAGWFFSARTGSRSDAELGSCGVMAGTEAELLQRSIARTPRRAKREQRDFCETTRSCAPENARESSRGRAPFPRQMVHQEFHLVGKDVAVGEDQVFHP